MEQMILWRKWLHEHPGVGFAVEESVNFAAERLGEMGISSRRCGKCGLLADIGAGERCILLRADLDALPLDGGAAHVCGHDLHTAMLLGAAARLKKREGELAGRVRLMFQPAEEILAGAADMIGAGALEDPRPGAAVMLHVIPAVELPVGTAMLAPAGRIAPGAACFRVKLTGKGCHGALPGQGISPVTAAAHLVTALQNLPAMEAAGARLSVGSLQFGRAANVIPDSGELLGSLRAGDEEMLAFLRKRVEETAAGMAAACRCGAEVDFFSGCPPLVNDAALVELARRVIDRVGYGRQEFAPSDGGSEDFAFVSREVPGVMICLAAGEPSRGFVHPAHHPEVAFDEGVLPVGAEILAGMAMDWLAGA